ncbi:MAG: DUF2148 domain-containing protein [Eubacteriales bacterium]|nr:DUF2148 domain-containing protein [Eubacteriales bacterium]
MEEQAVLQTAARMCAAARTAPKAHGKDTILTLVLTGEDKDKLAKEMESLGYEIMGDKMDTWYGRDANNVRNAEAVVLIGAAKKYRGVPNCGYCGFGDCGSCKSSGGNCAFAYVDLGIAVSSAVNAAASDKVDCRIMFSIGKTAMQLSLVDEDVLWLGIPLSVSGKNIFFDRNIFHD